MGAAATNIITACALDCPDRCSHLATLTAGGVRLRGNPAHPYTRGVTCAKIRSYPERLSSPARITRPWLRRGPSTASDDQAAVLPGVPPPGFEPVSWDEALSVACDALDAARRSHPASILLLRSGGSLGITKSYADYVFGLLGARGTRGSLCDAAGIDAVTADAGTLAMNDPREIDAADTLVLWGKDPAASSVHVAHQVRDARRRGAAVIAVNCDTTRVSALADHVVRIRPGTDRHLALAVTKSLLGRQRGSEGGGLRVDTSRCAGLDGFLAMLEAHSLDALLAACDVTQTDAELLAAAYEATPRVATILGWGLQRHPFGGENVRAIHALTFVAGTLGIPGGGLYYNIASARNLRTVDSLLAENPSTPPMRAPPLSWSNLPQELGAADPPVRVAWIMCSNIANQGPDAGAFARALTGIETVVTIDAFWTETARRSTLVLPPSLWLEEEDAAGSCWRNEIGALRRVTDPPDGCRGDFEILADVARRLALPTPFATADEWLGTMIPGGAAALARLRREGWLTIDHPSVAWRDGFAYPDRRFHLLQHVSPEPRPAADYPLRLLTVVRAEQLHSQLPPARLLPRRTQIARDTGLPVRIHPQTAAAVGIADGRPVRVSSRVGTLFGSAVTDEGLHPEAVACPRGGWIDHGEGVNLATEAVVTDIGETAAFYATQVRLDPAG